MTPRLIVELALQATVVCAAAGLACSLWRRASASARHLVWGVALLTVAALPAIRLAPPLWQPSFQTAQAVARPVAEVFRLDVTPGAEMRFPLLVWLGVLYGAGFLWSLGRWALSARAAAKLARRALDRGRAAFPGNRRPHRLRPAPSGDSAAAGRRAVGRGPSLRRSRSRAHARRAPRHALAGAGPLGLRLLVAAPSRLVRGLGIEEGMRAGLRRRRARHRRPALRLRGALARNRAGRQRRAQL